MSIHQSLLIELERLLDIYIPKRKQERAVLGNGVGVVGVENQANYSWVRIGGDESKLVQAFNPRVANIDGLPVTVAVNTEHRSGLFTYEVIEVDPQYQEALANPAYLNPYLREHHTSHEYSPAGFGHDPVDVFPRAFTPLRVTIGVGLLLTVGYGFYMVNNGGNFYWGGSVTVTPPETGVRYDLVYIDAYDNIAKVREGDIILPLQNLTLPPLLAKELPLLYIRVSSGASQLYESDVFCDIRPFFTIYTDSDDTYLRLDGENQDDWTPDDAVVTDLNSDLLDGNHATAFAAADHAHDSVYLRLDGGNQGQWTPDTDLVAGLNADLIDGLHADELEVAGGGGEGTGGEPVTDSTPDLVWTADDIVVTGSGGDGDGGGAAQVSSGLKLYVGYGALGDNYFATIGEAVEYLKNRIMARPESYIYVAPGVYNESIELTDWYSVHEATVRIIGDPRVLAGVAYIDSAAACGWFGYANGGDGIVALSNAGNQITVATSGSQPDFAAANYVAGDKIYVRDNAGVIDEYTIASVVTNKLTLTDTAPNVGNPASAVILVPNRRIEYGKVTVKVNGVNIEGFFIHNATTALLVDGIRGASVLELRNCLLRGASDYAILVKASRLFAYSRPVSAFASHVLLAAEQMSNVYAPNLRGITAASGIHATDNSHVFAPYCAIADCSYAAFSASNASVINADESYTVRNVLGFRGARQSYLYAGWTFAKAISNVKNYEPAVSGVPGNSEAVIDWD